MRQKNERIVILGGGYAGSLAAARIARRGIPVTLVDAGEGLVERIRMHQVAAGDDIRPVPFSRLFRKLPVDVVRTRVTAIDRAQKRVVTTDGFVDYDRLVYALGSTIDEAANALTLNDPRRVRERLRDAKRVAIVGGGLTGIELAAELADRRPELDVTLVSGGSIGSDLSERARRYLHEWFASHRVTLRESTRVDSAESLDADVVLWCASFRVSDIARNAGLEVNGRGQVVVDDRLRSSDPSIYAIGDAAAFLDVRMGCVSAMPMGAYVADEITGHAREPFRFAFGIRCISLGRSAGLIQFVHPDDSPRDAFLSGRPAAWVKELICRFTVTSVRLEAKGLAYHWPKAEPPQVHARA